MRKLRARDTQRRRLYDAERKTPAWNRESDFIMDVKDIQKYVNRICESKFVQRYGRMRPVVSDGRGCSHARGSRTVVKFPRWSRFKLVIIHELCHGFTDCKYGIRGVPAHGWQFAQTYLELVRHFLGREDYEALKAAYKEKRVRSAPKRQGRPPSPAAIAALKKYREERQIAAKSVEKPLEIEENVLILS